ncbi:alpha/beta fold hydrolase [Ancylomarina sp. 16SWW S1-10-2]|uniref:alpha/beta fold hydrolase n=1 Tax=Ancylomarina sp. 16SWW S1-10-2 TaxID=2499681 RepID=UPI0012AEA90E|nr:alpha/beta fold hydrolase [Ancylomarina sp. 16SWW S1-10-2]MRT92888.1 alpha/beta fold hydrolase [Ancylomarina sp. 16SWW S1-10-2]
MKNIILTEMNRVAKILVSALVFIGLTGTAVYAQTADPVIFNKDANNKKQRPFIVDKKEYPFKSNWFEKDGISMHYIDEGEGIPIVLTHGNPDWSFLNRNIIKQLSGEARVIAYDLPGFGFSDTPQNFDYTPQEYVEWISALLFEHLKLDKFIIVVQDWGGPTGLSVATSNPDHILGLVISNTWAWKAEGKMVEFSMQMRTPEMEQKVIDENFFATALMQSSINEKSRNNKAITDAYAMPFPTKESRRATAAFPQQITLAEPWLEKLEGKLSTLKDKPVELIFGLKDDVVASQHIQDKWRTYFPKAPVQLLPDAGHFTQEDSPESFVFSLRRMMKKIKSGE